MRISSVAVFVVMALSTAVARAAAPVSAPQGISDGELQRFIYLQGYPMFCSESAQMARDMRAKPTTDPKFLHKVMKANIGECANTQQAQKAPAVWTTAVFAGAAAALLAARHEQPAQALQDAKHAEQWSNDLVNFERQPGYANVGPGQNYSPSMHRTDAGRINRDAAALIKALHAAKASSASPDALPEHAAPPGPPAHSTTNP